MNFKILFFVASLFFLHGSWADERLLSISFGPVEVGASRIPLKLSDFKIFKSKKSPEIVASFQEDSVQWVRTNNNLLTPRALLRITINSEGNYHIEYLGRKIIPQGHQKKFVDLYVDLFTPGHVLILKNAKEIEKITLETKLKAKKGEVHLIDYSCSRYNVEIEGLDDEYLSVGCLMDRTGKFGKERPRLTVSWTTTNYSLVTGSPPPYITIFKNSIPAEFQLVDREGNIKNVSIKVKIPRRLKRLKTALGVGPYGFRAQREDAVNATSIAPAAMAYARLDLTNTTSFRLFNALVTNKSFFNNAGIYFAYELADAFDQRLQFVPLLGLQGLSFKFNSASPTSHKIIYPQGLEVVYNHAFGITNYQIVYGMFLSTQSQETYDNAWIRWGKKYFWEVNYIRWGRNTERAQTWGLSIGIPFLSFF